MTYKISYREQGRAVFLTAMMVLSVVAMATAFTGGAAATATDGEVTFDDQEVSDPKDPTVTVENVTTDGAATIVVVYVSDTDQGDRQTRNIIAGTTVADGLDGEDVSVSIKDDTGVENGSEHAAMLFADSDLDPDYAIGDALSVSTTGETLDFEYTDNITVPEHPDGEYDAGPAYNYAVNQSLPIVWAGQEVTLAHSGTDLSEFAVFEIREGANPDTSEPSDTVADGLIEDGEISFETNELDSDRIHHVNIVAADGASWDDTLFRIEEENLDVSFDDDTIFDTERAAITIDSERESHTVNVTEVKQGLDADEFAPLFETVETANGTLVGDEADITIDDLHDDESVVTIDMPPVDGERELDLATDELDAGAYEFEFDVTDSHAVDTTTLDVRQTRAIEDAAADRGDLVNITVTMMEDADESAVVIDGGDDSYEAGLELEAADEYENGDEIVIQMNTHLAGSGGGDEGTEADAYRIHEDSAEDVESLNLEYVTLGAEQDTDTESSDSELDATPPSSPLDDGTYDLTIGSGWDTTDDDTVDGIKGGSDTATLTISDHTPAGEVTLHTAPAATPLDDSEDLSAARDEGLLTEANDVADGDAIVAQAEAFGLGGLLDSLDVSDGDDIGPELAEAGVTITVATDAGENASAEDERWATNQSAVEQPGVTTVGDSDDDEAADYNALEVQALTVDDYDGDLFLNVITADTADTNTDSSLPANASFDLTFEIDADNDYVDDEPIVDELRFDRVEPELAWDSSAEEIEATNGSTATGTTTVAPGTELTTRATAPETFDLRGDDNGTVTVDANGTFTASFAVGDYDPGTGFELLASNDDYDSYETAMQHEINATLVEADDSSGGSGGGGGGGGGPIAPDPDLSVPSAVISIDPDPASIGENVTISGVDSTDDERDISSYDWTIDGETISGGTVTKVFDAAGTYDVELTVTNTVGESDTATATVTVEEDDAPADTDDDVDDDVTVEEPDDTDDDADDDIPGFGAAVAALALLATALLALRSRD